MSQGCLLGFGECNHVLLGFLGGNNVRVYTVYWLPIIYTTDHLSYGQYWGFRTDMGFCIRTIVLVCHGVI